jgi:pimeloyl-ACP methyl ester carboxylesterase
MTVAVLGTEAATLEQCWQAFTVDPRRTRLITEDAGRINCWALDSAGTAAGDEPNWSIDMGSAGWRILSWADERHLALWQRGAQSQVRLLDSTDGSAYRTFQVLGRPIQCRLDRLGMPEVLLAIAGPAGTELYRYRVATGRYDPVASTGGVLDVGAWDTFHSLFAVTVAGDRLGLRLFRPASTAFAEVTLQTQGDVRPVHAHGQAGGRIALTGVTGDGQTVPGVLECRTGGLHWFTELSGLSAVELSPSGERLLVNDWQDQRYRYLIVEVAGGRRLGEHDPSCSLVTEVHFAADERHLIGRDQSPADPPRITNWLPGSAPVPVTWRTPMRWQHRWLPDLPAQDMPEWVFEPADGATVGSVLFLHGGPRGRLRQEYDPVIAGLVDAGWAVVGPNYPGSTDYGSEYRERGRGDWGGVDLAALRRRLICLAETSNDQPVCVYGQSYGGYLALLLAAAEPALVSAVTAWAPVTDLPQLAASVTGVRSAWLAHELGAQLAQPELLLQRSPVHHAATLASARLLIGHGRLDDRCSVSQSRRLVELIGQAGPTIAGELHYLEDTAGHAPSDWQAWTGAVVSHFATVLPRGR